MSVPEPQYYITPAKEGGAPAHRIGYLDWPGDREDAPVVFCVHGLTRNAHDFDFLAAGLLPDFRVISVDMAGRGYSDWLEDKSGYHYGTYVADCLALLDYLDLECVRWVGTSMGGIIGMTLAAGYPERVGRLVLGDIGSMIPAAAMERIVSYAGVRHVFESRAEAEEYLREVAQPFGIKDPMHWRRFLGYSIWEIEEDTFTLAYDPDILTPYREQTKNFREITDVNLMETWMKVECPVLLLRGETSDVLPKAVAGEMAKRPNVSLVEFPGCGHAPALMEDEQVRRVAHWLRAALIPTP